MSCGKFCVLKFISSRLHGANHWQRLPRNSTPLVDGLFALSSSPPGCEKLQKRNPQRKASSDFNNFLACFDIIYEGKMQKKSSQGCNWMCSFCSDTLLHGSLALMCGHSCKALSPMGSQRRGISSKISRTARVWWAFALADKRKSRTKFCSGSLTNPNQNPRKSDFSCQGTSLSRLRLSNWEHRKFWGKIPRKFCKPGLPDPLAARVYCRSTSNPKRLLNENPWILGCSNQMKMFLRSSLLCLLRHCKAWS